MAGFVGAFVLFGLYYFFGLYWINPQLPLWEWLTFIVELIYPIGTFYILFAIEKGKNPD